MGGTRGGVHSAISGFLRSSVARALVPSLGIVLLVAALASSASAQAIKQEGEFFDVTFDEQNGTDLAEFITTYQRVTGRVIHYEEKDLKDAKIYQLGTAHVAKNRFDIYFGAVLRNLDYLIMQFGPSDAGFLALRKLGQGQGARAGQQLKTQAQIVLPSQLETLADNPGLLATTSITTKYLPAREAVNSLNMYFAEQSTETIRNIEGTETILMTGFANNLVGIVRLIREIDREPSDAYPLVNHKRLDHAVSDEIQPVLKELIDAYTGTSRPGGGGGAPAGGRQRSPNSPGAEPEPTVISDPHSNSLFITAGPKTMAKILEWVKELDIEVDPRGDTHVYRLRNSKADTMQEVLIEVVQGSSRSSTSRSSGGPGQTRPPSGPGPTGGGGLQNQGGSTGTGEQPVIIVSDKDTNSLVITASKTRYAQLLEIITKLDVRPKQVLIEAALIEITGTLQEQLGVELGYVKPNATSKTPFGLTSFGITTLIDTNGDGFPDSRGLALNTSGQLPNGITGGIFDPKDFALPFVLQAIANTSNANVLSLPSVLTNDNAVASVTAQDTNPYAQTNQGVNSDQTSYAGSTKAGITLKISPTISAGGYLSLNINLTISAFSGPAASANLPPPTVERTIVSQVTLPDGHTVVFGGVFTNDQNRSEAKIPLLGDIPILGFLFRSTNDSDKKTNLYFFCTPHIIADDFATLDDLTAKHKLEAEKLNGKVKMLDRFFGERDMAAAHLSDTFLEKYFEMPAYASVTDKQAAPSPDLKTLPEPAREQ